MPPPLSLLSDRRIINSAAGSLNMRKEKREKEMEEVASAVRIVLVQRDGIFPFPFLSSFFYSLADRFVALQFCLAQKNRVLFEGKAFAPFFGC